MLKNKFAFPTILLIIAIISHLQWFNPFSVLNFSDWSYWSSASVKELWYSWGAWVGFFNFGSANIQIPFLTFKSVWSLLAHVGLTYDQAVKVTFLIPIAILGFMTPYLLLRRLLINNTAAFGGALFYGTTTYFLVKQAAHMPIAFVYALAPLIIYLFLRALRQPSVNTWALFALSYLIGLGYEVRIMLIVSFVLVIYYLTQHFNVQRKTLLTYLIGVGLAIAGMSAYWVLPSFFNSSAIGAVAGRGLFGNFLFDLAHAFTLSEFSWTGDEPSNTFVLQPILWYLWLWPLLAFGSFIFYKRFSISERKLMLLFALLALIGIFLTKQSTEPLGASYQWFYDHLPGFSLFREASKFYLLTAIGYAGLIGFSLLGIQRIGEQYKKSWLIWIPLSFIIVLALLNLRPLLTNQFGTMFVPRHEPQDYVIMDKFISDQPQFFRTFWLPISSRWGTFTDSHPKVNAVSEITGEWSSLLDTKAHDNKWPIEQQLTDFMKKSFTQKLLSDASVKYVVVPLRDTANEDDFFVDYGGSRDIYIQTLDKIPWLKRLDIGTRQVAIYENTTYKPHFSVSDQLIGLSTSASLHESYKFLESTGNGAATLIDDKHASLDAQVAHSVFDPTSDSLQNTGSHLVASTQLSTATPVKLYKNMSTSLLGYKTAQGHLTVFTRPADDLTIYNQSIMFPKKDAEKILMTTSFSEGNYYILIDGNVIPVEPNKTFVFGDIKQFKSIDIYKSASNQVPNSSFEKGFWQPKVEDCNNYDSNGKIGMSLNTVDHVNGRQSLQLEATRHIACSTTAFPVKSDQSVFFGMAYQSPNAKQAGYYLAFNDPAKTIIKDILPITDDVWHNILKPIRVPSGATSASIAIYAYESDGQVNNIVRYDNVTFSESKLVSSATPSGMPDNFVSLPVVLQKGSTSFDYAYKDQDSRNLIKNPSFEDGLWESQLGDCNNYDHNAKIVQGIDRINSTDGKQSLQLEATRHNACTTTSSTLPTTGSYLLKFDYQSPNAKQAGYYLAFNDAAHTIYTAQLPISSDQWQHFQQKVIAPSGATSLSISFYAYQSDGRLNNIVRYDNVSFQKIPDVDNVFYTLTDPTSVFAKPRQISYTSINPTKQTIRITAATKPFVLNSSESFNPGWKLYAVPLQTIKECGQQEAGQQVSLGSAAECASEPRFMQKGDIGFAGATPIFDDRHLTTNGYANGWIIDPAYIRAHYSHDFYRENSDGSIDFAMVVYFKPQSYFYLGLLLSAGTTVVCCGVLVSAYLRRTWRHNHRVRFRTH